MKQFMEIAGRRMAYLDEGQGPALLFGHSYLWDSAMWAPQIEALKGQYRCIVPELWGHGDSDVLPEGPCTLATLARDHLALLDALGIDECVLVGLSIGGMWGVELARMAPARLKGLVLMAAVIGASIALGRSAPPVPQLIPVEVVEALPAPAIAAEPPPASVFVTRRDFPGQLGGHVFIAHDLPVVRDFADRVIVMRQGRIVEEGPTGRILSHPLHPVTRRLVAAAPILPQL